METTETRTDISCVTDRWYDITRLDQVKFRALTLQATEMREIDMNDAAPLGTFLIRVGGNDVFQMDVALLLHLCTKSLSGAAEYTFLLPEDMFLADGIGLPCNDLIYHEAKFMIHTKTVFMTLEAGTGAGQGRTGHVVYRRHLHGARNQESAATGTGAGTGTGPERRRPLFYNFRISYTTSPAELDLEPKRYQCRAYYNQGHGLPHNMRTRVFVYVPESIRTPIAASAAALTPCFSVLPRHTEKYFGPQMRALQSLVPRLPWEMIEMIFSFLSPHEMGRFYIIKPPMDVCVPEGCRVIDEFHNEFRTCSGIGGLFFVP